MRSYIAVAGACALSLVLSACQRPTPIQLTAASWRTEGLPYSPNDRIDLITLIDPENRRSKLVTANCQAAAKTKKKKPKDYTNADLQCAYEAFGTYVLTDVEFNYFVARRKQSENTDVPPPTALFDPQTGLFKWHEGLPTTDRLARLQAKSFYLANRRNQIQDQVIAQSRASCRYFKKVISDSSTVINFSLGGITTTLAGLGSIFTSAGTARALAGAAGISSGINAQYNSAFFKQQAVSTILAGIDLRQETLYKAIEGKRFAEIDQDYQPDDKKNFDVIIISRLDKEARNEAAPVSLADSKIAQDVLLGAPVGFIAANTADLPSSLAPKKLQNPNAERGRTARPPVTRVQAGTDTPPASGVVEPGVEADAEDEDKRFAIVGITSYTLAEAIIDAIYYHEGCSIASGLAEAEKSILAVELGSSQSAADALDDLNNSIGTIDELYKKMQSISEANKKGAQPPT
ncbi:MAG: hypothetical protein AAGL49_04875 [Pseudomonadota bacterium]